MATYDMLVPLVQQLVDAGELTWNMVIQALSSNSALIAMGRTTNLTQGEEANLTLIDPNYKWTLNASSQLSQGTNQALTHQTLKARVKLTVRGGQPTYKL